jgi:hypothetical protein
MNTVPSTKFGLILVKEVYQANPIFFFLEVYTRLRGPLKGNIDTSSSYDILYSNLSFVLLHLYTNKNGTEYVQ